MPVDDQFWGDRFGKVTDPFGHNWSIATHVEDVSAGGDGRAREGGHGRDVRFDDRGDDVRNLSE